MELLPPNIENKIFYYISHPIADLLKKQEIVLIYPYSNGECDAHSVVFTNGLKSGMEIGVYHCDSRKINYILRRNRDLLRSHRLYACRILRRYLPSYAFEIMKEKNEVSLYIYTFCTGQNCVRELLQ